MRKRPHALVTPILPEKTGTKMLLSLLIMPGTGQSVNAIVDLDLGLVTPYPADGAIRSVVQNYGSGLMLTDMSYGGLRFDTWQPTGPTGSVTVLPDSADIYNPASVLAGDVFWSMF